MNDQFESLSLKKAILDNLKNLNFTAMTPIQAATLPLALETKDIIAQAKTGSGKTAAFALSILNSLELDSLLPQALILAPTRELAEQVAGELRRLARGFDNVKILTLCGGVIDIHQEKSISHGAHIIVGTPGRVLKFAKKRTLKMDTIKTFVLDEADRMLDMGFSDDIRNIAIFLPKQRHNMLFSATFPEDIKDLSRKIQNDAVEVKIDVDHEKNTIEQKFFKVEGHAQKDDALIKVLGHYQPDRLIVFCKTKAITQKVEKLLLKNDIQAACIHGDLAQNERTAVLTKFSNNSLSVLVATDVAARGLDIKELAAVINYDLPMEAQDYIHRIGRTGRAGKTGLALSFYIEQTEYKIEAIEEQVKQNLVLAPIESLVVSKNYIITPPMKTLFISGGKKNKLRPGDIVGAMVGEAKINAADVGNISVLNVISYVAVKASLANEIVEKLNNGKIKNKKFKVGLV
jgi:ATP-independent RNA helicase DbpA